MGNSTYESDAAFFEVVALETHDKEDQAELRRIAAMYRALAQTEQDQPAGALSRHDFWRKRAAECRAIMAQFTNAACRSQLERLAEAYELMASTYANDFAA